MLKSIFLKIWSSFSKVREYPGESCFMMFHRTPLKKASVLNEVKTRFPGIYIVPVTDSIGKDKLEWAIRRGAADFIEKPCSPDDVENILDILERDC